LRQPVADLVYLAGRAATTAVSFRRRHVAMTQINRPGASPCHLSTAGRTGVPSITMDLSPPADPSLPEKRAALLWPATYPEPAGAITLRETHMSCVFLAGGAVYKLKKPVHLDRLDYTTLDRRRRCCEAEVALNRRLAPGVYLGTVPLVRAADGTLRLGGEGEVVDWLVKMRRLPSARLLDAALADSTATVADVEAAAAHLAAFFRAAPAERVGDDGHLARFAHDLALDRALLCDPAFGLADAAPASLLDLLADWLDRERALLLARLHAGQVIEGHGDLRPEHVFLGPPPAVIDCLEFDRALRLLDPAEEVAFLALECALLDAAWAGTMFRDCCAGVRGDAPSPRLWAFYTAFRACLRARLAVGHLRDAEPRAAGTWLPKARRYLALAWDAARALSPPAGR
jgi:aminoglycoside phosphotransferase family enzyme